MDALLVPLISPLVLARPVMTIEEHKMFSKFVRMDPLCFTDVHKEDAYEFLMSCQGGCITLVLLNHMVWTTLLFK